MEITELNTRGELKKSQKLVKAFNQFDELLAELRKKELTNEVTVSINQEIEKTNTLSGSGKELRKQIAKAQSAIIHLVEKKLKIVPKHHYRNTWLAVGMAVFGVPLGVIFGTSLGNMAFIGIGLPIGMAIGMAVGTSMDKKAFDEGRQLNVAIEI